jgi:hypothetical protein
MDLRGNVGIALVCAGLVLTVALWAVLAVLAGMVLF